MAIPSLKKEVYAENQVSKDVLGMEYKRDLVQTLIEMGYSLIDHGLVKDRRKKNKKNTKK